LLEWPVSVTIPLEITVERSGLQSPLFSLAEVEAPPRREGDGFGECDGDGGFGRCLRVAFVAP